MTARRDYARELCEALHGTIWPGDLEAVQPLLDAHAAEAVAADRVAITEALRSLAKPPACGCVQCYAYLQVALARARGAAR